MKFKTAKEGIKAIKNLSYRKGNQAIIDTWNLIETQQFTLDAVDYTILLNTCKTPSAFPFGEKIYGHLKKNLPPKKEDTFLKTALVNMFVKCGKPTFAVDLWDDRLRLDRVSYICFLSACTITQRYAKERRGNDYICKESI